VRPVPAAESESIALAIRRSGAGMVWVGMGTPAQDIWMDAFARRIGVPMAGVGSAFDWLSGRTRPAPGWVRRSGLQWLFRLAQEPRRLGPRYLTTNPRFLWHAARELARGREPRVSLRPATADDARRLFDWRNEEATRQASFGSDPIPWAAHELWLAERLAPGSQTRIFVVLDMRGREVGYVRFDVDRDGCAEVSVAIDTRERGRGLGTAAIRAATERIAADAGVQRVVARVRPENRASRTAFGRAGYTEMTSDVFERVIARGPS
jgi:RimJ/RimL family protein N-acetyltransferase